MVFQQKSCRRTSLIVLASPTIAPCSWPPSLLQLLRQYSSTKRWMSCSAHACGFCTMPEGRTPHSKHRAQQCNTQHWFYPATYICCCVVMDLLPSPGDTATCSSASRKRNMHQVGQWGAIRVSGDDLRFLASLVFWGSCSTSAFWL